MTAKSIHGNSPEEIRLALEQSLSDDFTPTLAIVFISIKQDRKAVSTMLDKMGIDVIGATSAGEFTDGHQSEGASVIMLLDIPKEEYSIFFETIGDGSSRPDNWEKLPFANSTILPSSSAAHSSLQKGLR